MKKILWIPCLLIIVLAFIMIPHQNTFAANEEVFQYQIMNGAADPFVTYHDGNYYMVYTQVNKVDIYKSPDLADIANGEVIRAFTPPEEGWGSKNIWAPKLHHIDGKWYLYYTADDGVDANHRMYVMENESSDPMSNNWINKGQVENMPDIFAIDGNTFEHNGERYLVWSTRTDGIMELWMDTMINPWTISGEPVVLSTPTYDWEKVDGAVNEGPAILKRNGQIFLTYSATGCQSPDYAIGMLTAPDTADLLDPNSWDKSAEPVFSKNPENSVYGPGHNSFTTSPDGTEDWMVYHANSSPDAGCTGARGARVQKVEWNEDGTPDFGTPNKVQILVECVEGRYEAQDAVINNAIVQSHNQQASCGKHVGNMDFNDSYVEFQQVYAPSAGEYEMTISYAHGMDSSSHFVSVNNAEAFEVHYPSTGWGNWTETNIDIELDSGLNTIRFAKGLNFSELNYISIEEKIPSEGVIMGPLQAKVDEVGRLNQSDYTLESWTFLQNMIEEAQYYLDNPNATQDQLNDVFNTLAIAVSELVFVNDPSVDGAPKLISAEIDAETPDRLMLTFDQAISLDYANGFFLLGTEGAIRVASVNYRMDDANQKLTLRLSRKVQSGELVSISYDDTRGTIKAETGEQPLASIIAKLVDHGKGSVSVDAMQQLIGQYVKTGDIKNPLAMQLRNKLNQSQHYLDKGSKSKAKKHMDDLLNQLNNKAMQKFISEEAKETLEKIGNNLSQAWEE